MTDCRSGISDRNDPASDKAGLRSVLPLGKVLRNGVRTPQNSGTKPGEKTS